MFFLEVHIFFRVLIFGSGSKTYFNQVPNFASTQRIFKDKTIVRLNELTYCTLTKQYSRFLKGTRDYMKIVLPRIRQSLQL